jgi:hypothetical protein
MDRQQRRRFQTIEDLDALLAQRRTLLNQDRELIAAYTAIHGGQSRSPPH